MGWSQLQRAQEQNERSVIASKKGTRQQGTLEEMDAIESCIRKGCLSDPHDMDNMYIPTRVQPKTMLQERFFAGDSCRNEARHRLLNQIVKHVSRGWERTSSMPS